MYGSVRTVRGFVFVKCGCINSPISPASPGILLPFWFLMARVETRVTSVQVVAGFPASVAIPNPPGWDPLPLQRSCSVGYSSSNTSASISGYQRERYVGEDTDVWFSSSPGLVWSSDLPLSAASIETLSASEFEETGTLSDSKIVETALSSYVSWTIHSSRR